MNKSSTISLKTLSFFIICCPLIFLFLPAFVLYINSINFIRFFNFILPIGLFLAFILKPKAILNNFIFLSKKSPMIYLLLFLTWCIIASLFALLSGYYSLTSFFIYCVIQMIFRIFLIYSFPIIIVPNFFNLKFIIKIFFIAYIIIFILGILEFVSAVANLTFVTNMIHFLSNIQPEDRMIISGESGLLRIRSLFDEPGSLGQFIAINMPIIYSFVRERIQIFENKRINLLIHQFIIPLMLINLILTQSPIYILISMIVTLLFFIKNIKNFLIKQKLIIFLAIVIIFISIFLLHNLIDVEKTPLYRIIRVISVFNNFSIENLIIADYSLATRIINYINQFIIFIHHPILGIGFGNNEHILFQQLKNSPVPLTQEIYIKMATTNRVLINTNVMYLLLHQTGIVGYLLYVIFILKTLKIFKLAKKYFSAVEKIFIDAMSKTIVCMLILSSVYNIGIFYVYLWFYLGLACSVLLIVKKGNINERKIRI